MIPKFRAWHKEYKIWCEPYSWTIEDWMKIEFSSLGLSIRFEDDDLLESVQYKDIELMQWTGWKDSNKEDLYIGDIVQFADEPPTLLMVKPNIGEIGYSFEILKQGGDYEDWFDHDEFGQEDITIIGNIYENPELLERK